MTFKLCKWAAEPLRKIDLSDSAPIIEESEDRVYLTIPDDSILDLQLNLNEEISLKGLDNQNTVNELGKQLYKIYDEILSQID